MLCTKVKVGLQYQPDGLPYDGMIWMLLESSPHLNIFRDTFPHDSVFSFHDDSLWYTSDEKTARIEPIRTKTDSSSTKSSTDPLLEHNYQEDSRDFLFQKAVRQFVSKISDEKADFLDKYHSPILPVINSTGLGKTRFLLNNLRPGRKISSYFCFPRYDGNLQVNTWLPTISWEEFNFVFKRHIDEVTQGVLFYQCFLLALAADKFFHPSKKQSESDSKTSFFTQIIRMRLEDPVFENYRDNS
ncbi:hypothetical protein P9112_006460 [Eukaryota sp. TZLM1-RC]